MIEWIRDRQGAIALDSRQHPALIATWYGGSSVELIDRYYRWSDATVAEALAAEQRLIRIADLRAAAPPASPVCKRFYEHAGSPLINEVTLVTYVVVSDPQVGRVIKGMGWLESGQSTREILVVDSMATALELSLARFRAERIPAPAGLDPVRYEPPRFDSLG